MNIILSTKGRGVENRLTVNPDRAIPQVGSLLIDATRLEEVNWQSIKLTSPVGAKLMPDQPIDIIEPWLDRLDLVRLYFPTFADGRAFSQARLLRTRYHFSGDIRAAGEILQDQLAFMLSCGFNQFELSPGVEPLDIDSARADAYRFGNMLAGTADDASASLRQTGT